MGERDWEMTTLEEPCRTELVEPLTELEMENRELRAAQERLEALGVRVHVPHWHERVPLD